jgi:endonuclease/exonuclease/phosphatase family metal-dependent hydrolase
MISPRRLLTSLCWYTGFSVGLLTPLPAEAIKVLNYNILNYPAASGELREDEFRTIMTAIHPDILVVQEVTGTTNAGMNQFLNNVLNVAFPGEYAAGTWFNGPDTDNALFYRTSAVTFVSADTLQTELRAIAEYVVRPAGYSSTAANLRVFSMHLKASSTSEDQAQRLREVTILRNYANTLPAGTHFIYAGDFNIQSSTEDSYEKMLADEADDDGRAFDPINTPGSWNNNASFAAVHTQSPKSASNPYGGATGGMDDRFDFQLVSAALLDGEGLSYVPGTYKCYGNDGLHFNLAINAPPTIPEGAAMANALHEASDHMPVIMEVQVPAKVNVVASLNIGTAIVGGVASANLAVSNSAVAPADELSYSFAAAPVGFTAPGGSFAANVGAGANNHSIGMTTGSAGMKNGNLTLNSDDVDTPAKVIALSGTVLNHAVPSVAANPPATADTVDFGSMPPGGFNDMDIAVHNAGYGSLQALLNVYNAAFTGPDASRFSIVGGFSAGNVGAQPAEYSLHFDDAGAAPSSTYMATLTFSTRDQQDLSGATNLANLTFELTAHVAGQTGVPDVGAPPARTVLAGNYPNPFQPRTTIAFDLATPGSVRLDIFDISGRLVTRLFEGEMGTGRFTLTWDSTDSRGNRVNSGVYFYRLEAGSYTATRTMTFMK